MYAVPFLCAVPACLWVWRGGLSISVFVSYGDFFVHFHVCLLCMCLLWGWRIRKCGLSAEFVYK